jgi:hypothetical protein
MSIIKLTTGEGVVSAEPTRANKPYKDLLQILVLLNKEKAIVSSGTPV